MSARLEIWGVDGLAEVVTGNDIAALIAAAEPDLQSHDIVVVTSKIISKAEGRLVPGSRDDHLASETVRTVARRGQTQIVETHHGLVLAAGGIDASNVPAGTVALLPVDPDASAARIRQGLQRIRQVDVAVIVSDTMGRPWRDGLVDTAIGSAGLDVMWDLRGQHDAAGHLLEATVVAVADELAAAGDLVKGKLASTPVAVIRGFPFTRHEPDRGARDLIRPAADDMFRLGTREAQHQVVVDSVPIPLAGVDQPHELVDRASVLRAVDLVGPATGVGLVVSDDGAEVLATGDPLAVGVVLGRLMVALAAEGLRCAEPQAPEDGHASAVLWVLG